MQRLNTNAIADKYINGTDMEFLQNFAIFYLKKDISIEIFMNYV